MALGGLKDVITGETLCDEKNPIMLERMEFPDPVIKVAPPPSSSHPVSLPHSQSSLRDSKGKLGITITAPSAV